jgi:hypothetical protein
MFRHRFYAPALSNHLFDFQNQLEQALNFWEKALIEKGHRNNYPDSIQLIDLPAVDKPGSWFQKYQKKLTQAREELTRYQQIKERIAQAKLHARRNEYNVDILNQINELQIYPAKLLLLLADYDKATASDRKVARRKIQDYVNSFSQLRKNYEKAFTKTRILENPADYILDANGHHHLANGTNNSDWMYVYELAMNNAINQWNVIQ